MAAFVAAARSFVMAPEHGSLGRQPSFSAAALQQLARDAKGGAAPTGGLPGSLDFLLSPGPVKGGAQCRVVRTRGGVLGSSVQFTMVLEEGRCPLMTATRHRRANGATGFNIMVSSPLGTGAQTCVAKLRANFLGTEYVVGGTGGDGEGAGAAAAPPPPRELGSMLYSPNVLGAKGPRKMTVVLPKLAPSGQAAWDLQPAANVGQLIPRSGTFTRCARDSAQTAGSNPVNGVLLAALHLPFRLQVPPGQDRVLHRAPQPAAAVERGAGGLLPQLRG
jgi:hypothetical protein